MSFGGLEGGGGSEEERGVSALTRTHTHTHSQTHLVEHEDTVVDCTHAAESLWQPPQPIEGVNIRRLAGLEALHAIHVELCGGGEVKRV